MGVQAYLAEQLDPAKLEDGACDKAVERCPILRESINSLFMEYPQPGINLFRPDLRGKVLSAKENEDAYGRIFSMVNDLAAARLTRIVGSRRQLYEVMVDFWFNHFNVAFDKNGVEWLVGSFERDVIRPHALGNFRELLTAVAKSPAMLVYLDNNDNFADPNFKPVPDPSMMAMGSGTMMMQNAPGKGQRINENYARELLELHTLGVDGGYSQKDVVETARVFTGWAVAGLSSDSAPQPVCFKFKGWHHDANAKTILGRSFAPDGEKEGEEVLAMLSRRPETAKRIAFKLCQRFVADEPPALLVGKVAETFLASDGDIRETLRAIFKSPEFLSAEHYRTKVKTPLEFVASALRALDARPADWGSTVRALETMGQPLYRCEAPTGYPQTAKAWVSSSSLLGRANYAAHLFDASKGTLPFSLAPFEGEAPGGQALVLGNAFRVLLNGEVSETTRKALASEREGLDTGKLAALVMASPDFQRR